MRARSAPLLCWLVLAGAGCATTLEGAPVNRCASDSDCSSGTCDSEHGMCVGDPLGSMRVGLEIVPATDPYGGRPVAVSFDPFEVTGPTDRGAFAVPLGVSVRGMLRDSEGGAPVSAAITLTLPSAIPGAPATRIETQTFADPMHEGTGERFNFELQLLPGREYDVTIRPNGPWRSKLPPLRRVLRAPEPGTRINREITWDAATLERIEGVLVDVDGVGQPGLVVRAVDRSGRGVSSTYTTGSDPARPAGWFEIVRDVTAEDWLFSINASASRIASGSPSPTLTVAHNVLFPGPELTIQVPMSPEVITYSGFVEIAGASGDGTPAALTFTATDVLDEATQVVGSFRTTVATNEEPGHEGEFSVQLLPGTYDVVITPTRPDLGVLRETVRLDPRHGSDVRGQIFPVPSRARYGGHVQTFDEQPMTNAQVRAQARGSTDGDRLPALAVYARSSQALTDPEGRFFVPLDIGLYDITVEPPSGTSWPWAIRRDVAIGSADAVLTADVHLGAPVPLTGRAVFADGPPVAGGEVRAYGIVEEPDGARRAVQIGRAETDAEGRFLVLLPPSF